MLLDTGILTLCTLEEQKTPGMMPKQALAFHSQHWYGERTIGYGRQYAARGINEQVDLLARIWECRDVRIGMYAVAGGVQYRVDNVQHLLDDNGLRVTDLSLSRLDDFYDVEEA